MKVCEDCGAALDGSSRSKKCPVCRAKHKSQMRKESYATCFAKNKDIYALYRGEENLCDGTIKEIADKMGCSPQTIYFYGTNVYKKRSKDSLNRLCLVYIGKE